MIDYDIVKTVCKIMYFGCIAYTLFVFLFIATCDYLRENYFQDVYPGFVAFGVVIGMIMAGSVVVHIGIKLKELWETR